ncbi:ester cyclase [Nocardia australiensis]|uniref:ester cyclase n=1 Tax=Nocardia australiensis TaxID=2887191 RepID=UPI001D133504|nr:nuclear transport factor 2 family protein [Nocardia australiensis]
MTNLEPTLVDGMTSHELAAAMPELVSTFTERAADQAIMWRDWSVRWLDAWDRHDLDTVMALVTDDVRYEDPSLFGEHLVGKAALREVVTMTWQAFPDVRFELAGTPYLAILGTGMAAPWRMRGTFAGDMGGGPSPLGIAPTGRDFDTRGIDIYALRDGLLSHWSTTTDLFDLARQVGLLPAPRTRLFQLVIRLQRVAAPLLRVLHRHRGRS